VSWLAETHGRQFELLRHFLARMFDGEWAGAQGAACGQWQSAAIGLFAMMLPAGMALIREGTRDADYAARYRYLSKLASPEPYLATAMADQIALLALVLAVTGLIALLEWQALFPSVRDHLALAGFPVHPRQIFMARFLAVLLFSAAVVAAMNLLPSLIAPLEYGGRWQKNPSYWVNAGAEAAACSLGCFFVFFALAALQGVLLNALPRRWFADVSAYVQGALAGVLLLAGLYSWSIRNWGPKTIGSLPRWGGWVPPVWFAGLHEALLGDRDPFYTGMARRAVLAALGAAVLTVGLYLVSYRRYRRLLLEAPRTAPSASGRPSWPALLAWLLSRDPRGQAVVEFMAKTLARSRTHRVVWTAYIGGAIAIMLNSSLIDGTVFQRSRGSWQQALAFVVLFWPLACCIVLLNGLRHTLSIPAELPANWIFQIHESQGRRQWMAAVERFIVAYAIAPVYLLLAPVAMRVVGVGVALRMTVLQAIVSMLIFEILFQSWQQFPFACSYRPGKKPLVGVLAKYIAMLGVVVPILTVIIATAARFAPLFIMCLAGFAGAWLKARAIRREGWGQAKLLYEDSEALTSLGIKELTYGGVEAQLRRTAAGDAGHADSQDPVTRADARLCGGGVHPADLRGGAAGGGGSPVSGAAPAGAARSAEGGVGSFREQTAGQVLPADGGGPQTTRRGEGPLGPHDGGHRAHHGARLSEGLFGETVTAAWLRMKWLLARRRLDRDLRDELAFHLALREERHQAEGMTAAEARAAARRELGNPTYFKETSRDMWTFVHLETFWQDMRYGARQLARSPVFAAAAALTLGVGIGATTSVFSMFDAVLQPVPVPQAERLAVVLQQAVDPHFPAPAAPADVADIRRVQTSLEEIASWELAVTTVVDSGGEALRVESARVTPNFFQVMGVAPAQGRGFEAGEDQPGHDRVAILSDTLWRRHFAADPKVLGGAIRIDNRNHTVIGIMPPGFQVPRSFRELWIPLTLTADARDSRRAGLLESAGRLKPGRTLPQCAAELDGIARRLEQQYPETNRSRRFVAWGIQRYTLGDYLPIWRAMLMGAALFVLLIGCVNVANLQLVRSMGRGREVAVRAALGAGRRRILRQLLTENVLVALGGGALGLLAAKFGLAAIKASVPAEMRRYMPTWDQIGLNPRALAVACAAALTAGIVSGLAPAWRASRPNLGAWLKEGGRGTSQGRARHRLAGILVAAEMALAVVLLVGAALLVQGFESLVAGRESLEPAALLSLRLTLDENRYPDPHQAAVFYREALQRLRAVPGVTSAAAVSALPHSRHFPTGALHIEGEQPPATPPSVMVQSVSTDYFRSLHIPLRAGRLVGDTDGPGGPLVAAISDRMARRFWPNQPAPLGQRIRLGEQGPWVTIEGVVGDILQSALDQTPRPIVYLPYAQAPVREMNLALRVAGDPLSLAPAVTAALRALDREQPIENVATLETLVRQETLAPAMLAGLMGVFGAVALLLAIVGVYGVTAYGVAERTHEIGVRVALGAPQGRVLRMLFRRGLTTVAIGLALGMFPAFALARLMASAVWGVGPTTPATLTAIPLLLAAAAALAIWIPARRALRVDPLAALRCE